MTHLLFTENGAKLYTSAQAAAQMGMTRNALMVMLHRHGEVRPARKVGADLFWTEGEIENASRVKATHKAGRPSK